MTVADNYSPARLADRAQIQDVMHRWCRAVDRLDVEGMRAVFHPDAIDAPKFDPNWAVGRRDRDDPIYKERVAMELT